jgi:hypothetical protein
LYNKLLHKCEFGQAHWVEMPNRSPMKFSLLFLDIRISSMNFESLNYFLLFKINGKGF